MCFVTGKVLFIVLLISVLLSAINMSTPRQLLAERILKAAAKKREAAEALVAIRDAGQGPLFNDAQVRILESVCKQKGMGPAEFMAECTAKIRPTLPPKATGEELLVFIDQAVKKIQEQNRPKPSFGQEDDSETMPKLHKLWPLVC